MKRRILSVLCCLALLSVLSVTAFASETVDLTRRGSISISMTHQGTAVPSGSLTLYRVADVVWKDGGYHYEYTQDFADCQVPANDPSTSRIAAALTEILREKSLEGTKKAIDIRGKVSFQNLEVGLYLLVQEEAAPGYEAVQPFLVSIPGREDDRYVYDVDGSPKLSLVPQETTAPTTQPSESTTPPGPEIPQTGQTNWPVPALTAGGLLLIAIGWFLCTSDRKKPHEE